MTFPILCAIHQPTRQAEQDENHSQGTQTDNRINNLLHQFPFSLPYGGYVGRTTGSWNARSTYGRFWSEGAGSGSLARGLYFGGADVGPEDYYYKTLGFPVRCVASQVTIREGQTTLLTKAIRNFRNLQDYQKSQYSQGTQTDNRINNLLHQFPFSLPYGGHINRTTGGWSSRSTGGYFWLEGADSGSSARLLRFAGANVGPEYGDYKTTGLPVRCVANIFSHNMV